MNFCNNSFIRLESLKLLWLVLIQSSCFCSAAYMIVVIERVRKCWDFSATLYIIHLFICIVYGGWPSSITWWIVNGTGFAVMELLGEHLCSRRENREIQLTRYRSSKNLFLYGCFADIHWLFNLV